MDITYLSHAEILEERLKDMEALKKIVKNDICAYGDMWDCENPKYNELKMYAEYCTARAEFKSERPVLGYFDFIKILRFAEFK